MSRVDYAKELASVMADAGSARARFSSTWDVEVEFVLRGRRTDVRVIGLDKDDPRAEYRIVDGTAYRLHRHLTDRPWKCGDEALPPRRPGTDRTDVGTPLGLLFATLTDAIVLARNERTTTIGTTVRRGSLDRAGGDLSATADHGDPVKIVWDLDQDGRPVRVSDDLVLALDFSDWGEVRVDAPPENEVESEIDWMMRGCPP